jgi:hypothetical protein
MKWRTPEVGDIRRSTTFAIHPMNCSDGFTYWLQRIAIVEQLGLDHAWTIIAAHPATADAPPIAAPSQEETP